MAKKAHKERSDADRRVRQCERLARLMQVLHLISGRGRWDAAALADELECSTRTIHRLLQTLSMAGVPWFFDEKLRAYRVRTGYKFPLLEEHLQKAPVPNDLPDNLSVLAEKLIRSGNAFASALQEFLDVLKATAEKTRTTPSIDD
ncbi:MAG: HTH domain-containing protein [Planctomycetaceae bacterium]